MTKAEFIRQVKNARGMDLTRREAEAVINVVFDTLAYAIKRDKRFNFPGFGTFLVRTRAGREGRDPRNQESIQIAPTRTVGFLPAPRLKNLL